MEHTIEVQKRGMLTPRIKQRSLELLGYEISRTELRLLPYIQYTLVNNQRIKPEHVNDDDREILAAYVEKGFITGGVTPKGRPMRSKGETLSVTKEFWSNMLEIIWLGYVDLNY